MKNKLVYLFAVLLCIFAGRASAQISGRRGICVGSSSTLSASGVGAWSSSNISVASVNSSTGEVEGVAVGTAIITYSVGTQTTTVTVIDPSTPLTLSPPYAGYLCKDAPWTVNAPSGGTWSSADTYIATAAVIAAPTSSTENATITGLVDGPVTVYVYCDYPGGCKAQALVKVGLPDIVGETDLCIGEVYDRLTCTSGGLTWTSNNPAIADFLDYPTQSGRLFGLTAGTTTVTFTRYSGCVETRTVNISAGSSITGTTSVCVGQTTSLSCSPSGGTWSSANTSVATVGASTGVVTGVAAGTAVVSYFPTEGCPSVVVITVSSSPGEIGGTLSVCQGQTTALSCSPGGGTWSSSNTSVATVNSTGVVTGVSAGTVTITYNLGGGCVATAELTVNANPSAITGVLGVCFGSTTTLSNSLPGGTWSSSNTGVATVNSSGVVSGTAVGTAKITYTTSGGCYVTAEVTVVTAPAAISGPSKVCVGYTITLTSSPAGGSWSSSDIAYGTVGTSNGVVGGVAFGTTTITYSLGTGCTATKAIAVKSNPVINESSNPSHKFCIGSTMTLSKSAIGSGTGTPGWSSSNTAIATIGSSSGNVTPVAAGTVVLSFTNSEGCYDTHELTIHNVPTISGTFTVCAGATTTLTGTESGGTWLSTSGAPGTVNSSGVVSGISSGTKPITYTLFSLAACRAIETVTVSTCGAKPGSSDLQQGFQLRKGAFSLAPNPNAGTFTLTGQLPCADACNVAVEVTDVLGKTIYSEKVSADKGLLNTKINLGADIANGVYLVRVKNNDISEVIRFTLER